VRLRSPPLLAVPLVILLALAATGSLRGAVTASTATTPTWAGLTRTQAIKLAESETLATGLALGTLTKRSAAELRHQLDHTPVTATRVTCNSGVKAWRVLWGKQSPSNDPAYVNRKNGLFISCR
jgi:hypothetical protein